MTNEFPVKYEIIEPGHPQQGEIQIVNNINSIPKGIQLKLLSYKSHHEQNTLSTIRLTY